MEIKLKEKLIPRNGKGDVAFKLLSYTTIVGDVVDPTRQPSVLNVFTPDEIVELVNRALYQIEYQRESHKKRG